MNLSQVDQPKIDQACHVWNQHVKLVDIMSRHCITDDDLNQYAVLLPDFHSNYIALYGTEIVTINLHYQTHFVRFVQMYVIF